MTPPKNGTFMSAFGSALRAWTWTQRCVKRARRGSPTNGPLDDDA